MAGLSVQLAEYRYTLDFSVSSVNHLEKEMEDICTFLDELLVARKIDLYTTYTLDLDSLTLVIHFHNKAGEVVFYQEESIHIGYFDLVTNNFTNVVID